MAFIAGVFSASGAGRQNSNVACFNLHFLTIITAKQYNSRT